MKGRGLGGPIPTLSIPVSGAQQLREGKSIFRGKRKGWGMRGEVDATQEKLLAHVTRSEPLNNLL